MAIAKSEKNAEVLQGSHSRVEDQQEMAGPTAPLHGGQTLSNLHPLIVHGTFRKFQCQAILVFLKTAKLKCHCQTLMLVKSPDDGQIFYFLFFRLTMFA